MQLGANQQLDRYTVLDMLGQGGMAMVYRLRHNQLETEHALKVLTITSRSVRQRLILEGKVQAQLRHPNIVSVTDVLSIGGAPGLLMEYIAGPSLDDWLERYRPNLDEVEEIFRGVVEGVKHAHEADLVHRDLKPANVMLARHGDKLIPKVADFGLAKAFAEEEEELEGAKRKHTRTGVAMGTPAYMSPEQIRSAKDVDVRADVYSLGCILYEMLTGELAFNGEDLPSIFNQVLSNSYTPVDSLVPDLPTRFRTAVLGCLTPDRGQRIPDCETLLDVLSGAAWASTIPAGDTWSGSAMDLVGDSAAPEDAETPRAADERVSWPPAGFSFSEEALEASYAPTPSELPTVEEIKLETMGASLLGTMAHDSMVPSVPQTVVVQGSTNWVGVGVNALIGLFTVPLLILILFFVARSNETVNNTLIAPVVEAAPALQIIQAPKFREPEPAVVAKTETRSKKSKRTKGPAAVVQDGTAEAEDAKMNLDDKTVVVNLGPTYIREDGTPIEDPEGGDTKTKTKTKAKTITAEVQVDEDDKSKKKADVTVAMTTEEIANLPEDKLPPGMGAVVVKGEATEVWLASDQGRIKPGLVLAGTYRILATFEGTGEVGAGKVHVPVGRKVELRCDALFRKCVK